MNKLSTVKIFITFISIAILSIASAKTRVIITPEKPTENDIIKVGIHSKGPITCYAEIPKKNPDGITQYITNEEEKISLHIFGKILPNFATKPGYCYDVPNEKPDMFFEIGKLPVGSYSLYTYISDYRYKTSSKVTKIAFSKEILFNVVKGKAASKSKPVPITNIYSVFTLLVLLMAVSRLFLKRGKK